MDFRAVLFDLDGTLLDTLSDIAGAVNTALAKLGLPGHPVDAYRYFVGDGIAVLAQRVLPPDRRNDVDTMACLSAINREYNAGLLVNTRPFDGIPELLRGLAAKNIPFAVVSNKPHELTVRSVAALFPDTSFAVVLGERMGVATKPDPAIAFEAAAVLSVEPHECLYVGDSGIDMRTAVSAGMYPVGVLWGFRDAGELMLNGAKTLIKHPLELLKIIDMN